MAPVGKSDMKAIAAKHRDRERPKLILNEIVKKKLIKYDQGSKFRFSALIRSPLKMETFICVSETFRPVSEQNKKIKNLRIILEKH